MEEKLRREFINACSAGNEADFKYFFEELGEWIYNREELRREMFVFLCGNGELKLLKILEADGIQEEDLDEGFLLACECEKTEVIKELPVLMEYMDEYGWEDRAKKGMELMKEKGIKNAEMYELLYRLRYRIDDDE